MRGFRRPPIVRTLNWGVRRLATVRGVLRLRTDELDWKLVEGEVVILDLRRSVYLSLNDTPGP